MLHFWSLNTLGPNVIFFQYRSILFKLPWFHLHFPVQTNTPAPCQLFNYLLQIFEYQLLLPNTFVTYNSTQLANELIKLKITDTSRLITFDIKDLYVNIP
jgi:hypothetical protein